LVNRATQGAYPAGSVFKIITFSAAVNSDLYTPDTRYTSTGTWNRLGDEFIKTDWLRGGHGTVSLRQALVVSCNSCFYDVGYNLDGTDNTLLPRIAGAFGLGQPTGIQGVAENSGLIPDPDWKLATRGEGWVTGDAVNMAIGQGDVQVTPLQIANILAAIANGGTLNQPTLIDHLGAGGGAPEEAWPLHVNGTLPLTAEQIEIIRASLWDVAHSPSGTATHRFVGLDVPVAGKTGTAEAPPGNSHAWFTGYAPAAAYTTADGRQIAGPEIAIAVILENSGEGSDVAAPLFRRVVELYYGIEPAPFPWE
jgi:penicillin-binding protein 2